MHTALIYILIGLGAAVGGIARCWSVGLAARWLGDTFPWGTLLVNVAGSALLGVFVTLTAPEGRLLVPSSVRLMIAVGVCGGFTTFSTFSMETLSFALDRQYLKAVINIVASISACLVGVWCGYVLASAVNQR